MNLKLQLRNQLIHTHDDNFLTEQNPSCEVCFQVANSQILAKKSYARVQIIKPVFEELTCIAN